MDLTESSSLSSFFYLIWLPVTVNIIYFLVHSIHGFEGGYYRRNTLNFLHVFPFKDMAKTEIKYSGM